MSSSWGAWGRPSSVGRSAARNSSWPLWWCLVCSGYRITSSTCYRCVRLYYTSFIKSNTKSFFVINEWIICVCYVKVAAEWYPAESDKRKMWVSEDILLKPLNICQNAPYLCSKPLFTCRLDHITKSSRAVTSALAFISSCANPVLYTFAGKSYIKQSGFAFMAQLFEGTSLEQTINKKSRVMGNETLGNSNVDSSNSTGIPLSQNGRWVQNRLEWKCLSKQLLSMKRAAL